MDRPDPPPNRDHHHRPAVTDTDLDCAGPGTTIPDETEVLAITVGDGDVRICLDVALRTDHSRWVPPRADEDHAFHRGELRFTGVTAFTWDNRSDRRWGDPTTEQTILGDLDVFRRLPDGRWHTGGDYGELRFRAVAVGTVWE